MPPEAFLAEERASIDRLIAKNVEVLRRAESVVKALVDVRAFSHATLYAEVAAHRAAHGHAGVFVSHVIERAITQASAWISGDSSEPLAAASKEPARILHVASQIGFPEGGHGRLMERWIRSDRAHQHSVVLTFPGYWVPQFLLPAIEASGGTTHLLAPGSSSFVERARHLRQIAATFDVIVLHTMPFDALPLLALGWAGRPPTIFCNHASHLFWLGRGVADVVTYGRESARQVCIGRRGVAPAACVHLPLPVEPHSHSPEARLSIRRQLGVEPDDLFLLTIASDFKLQGAGAHDLVRTISSVVQRRPRVVWRVVGPKPDGQWADRAADTGGRVQAVGTRADIADLYSAADAFIDSYPFTSRTALLDAAAASLPLMAPRWHSAGSQILSAWGSESADSAILAFDDERSLEQRLDTLEVADIRRHWGAAAFNSVTRSHVGSKWASHLPGVYQRARERRLVADAHGLAPHNPVPYGEVDDIDRYLCRLYSVPALQRVLLNWHRDHTNTQAVVAFPGDEEWLAEAHGLAALVGEQSLIIRDYEALVAKLRQDLEAAEAEVGRLSASVDLAHSTEL